MSNNPFGQGLPEWLSKTATCVERATVNKLRYMANHYSDWYSSTLSALAHSFWQCFHSTVLLNTVAYTYCAHTHTHMHTQTCIHTHTHTHICMHALTHTHMQIYSHIWYTPAHTHTHTHTEWYTHACTHTHIQVCIYTHTYAYTLTHAYTHSKTHTGTGMPAHTSMPLCALKWTNIELINLR